MKNRDEKGRFIKGHHYNKGKKYSEEYKNKQRKPFLKILEERLKQTKVCEFCKKEFNRPQYAREKQWEKIRFCNKECFYKSRIGYKHSTETKKKIGKSNSISKKGCKSWNKGLKSSYCGEKHWNWKGGISPEEASLRLSSEYKIWKLSVYKRDKGICQICGIRCNNDNIIAHHIKSFINFPKLRIDIDNGITLCRSCHMKLHNPSKKKLKGD